MPIDYRAEIRRPLSLAFGAAAVLGWLLVIAMWLSYSHRLQETRAEATRLQQAEGEARGQLDQQRRTAGDLANLQTRVADAQRGEPPFPLQIGPEQEVSQGHGGDLAADPMNRPKGLQESFSHQLHSIRSPGSISVGKLLVDPGHEVAPALIP